MNNSLPKLKTDTSNLISLRYLSHTLDKTVFKLSYYEGSFKTILENFKNLKSSDNSVDTDGLIAKLSDELFNNLEKGNFDIKGISTLIHDKGKGVEIPEDELSKELDLFQDKYVTTLSNTYRTVKIKYLALYKELEQLINQNGFTSSTDSENLLSEFETKFNEFANSVLDWLSLDFKLFMESTVSYRNDKIAALLDSNSITDWGNVFRQEEWKYKLVLQNSLPLIDKIIESNSYYSEDGSELIPQSEHSFDIILEDSLYEMRQELEYDMNKVLTEQIVRDGGYIQLKKAMQNVLDKVVKYNTNAVSRYIDDRLTM